MIGLPIVLGVTGHRDLLPEEVKGVEQLLEGLFNEIKARYSSTRLLLLTPLAEGADRLVARVALKCGAELYAVFPFAEGEYTKDFHSDESKREFHELRQQCSRHLVMAAVEPETTEGRNQGYELAGRFVARNAHILLALWNGEGSDKQGGTAKTLQFKLSGCFDPDKVGADQLDLVEPGRVLRVPVRRESSDHLEGRVGEPYWLKVKGTDPVAASLGWNFEPPPEAGRRPSNAVMDVPDAVMDGIDGLNKSMLAAGMANGGRDYYGQWFGHIDRLAIENQRRYERSTRAIIVLTIFAVVLVQLHQAFPLFISSVWAWSVGLMAALTFGYARWFRWKAKYEEYRGLAEALRVQHAWDLAGIDDCVADHYLALQHSNLNWIRRAIRSLHLLRPDGRFEGVEAGPRRAFDVWTKGQCNYFLGSIKKSEKKADRIHRWKWVCGCLAVVALMPIFPLSALLFEWPGPVEAASPVLHAAFLVVAAALAHYAELFTLTEQVERYKSASRLHQTVKGMLGQLSDSDWQRVETLDKVRQVLREAGRSALDESGQWLITRSERSLKPPT